LKIFQNTFFLWLLGLAVALVTFLSFSIPIGGSFEDVVVLQMNHVANRSPIKATLVRGEFDSAGAKFIEMKDLYGGLGRIQVAETPDIELGEVVIADVQYLPESARFTWMGLVRRKPSITFPLIQGLGELGRNMLLHVPMAMVGFIAFLMGTINSVLYLIKKRPVYDYRARAASAAGMLFTILATATGSLWARFSWGTFWNWDPRQTSIFILLLIYAAYFILRSLLEESEEKKARIAATYNAIAFVTVPFLWFVLPRITQSLHPGGGGTEAPILNLSGNVHTDRTLLNFHWLAVVLYTLVYVWIKDLYARVLALEDATYEEA
jgi:heme exporter protein C